MGSTFGWGEELTSYKFPADASTSGRRTFVARDMLWIQYNITGYGGGGDIAAFRFNGDSGNNYQTRYITVAIAGVVHTNVATLTTSMIRLAGQSVTTRRAGSMQVMNVLATNKVCKNQVWDDTAAVGTEPVFEHGGGGTWFNTSAQITSIEMITAGGANIVANSGFQVWGVNLG